MTHSQILQCVGLLTAFAGVLMLLIAVLTDKPPDGWLHTCSEAVFMISLGLCIGSIVCYFT